METWTIAQIGIATCALLMCLSIVIVSVLPIGVFGILGIGKMLDLTMRVADGITVLYRNYLRLPKLLHLSVCTTLPILVIGMCIFVKTIWYIYAPGTGPDIKILMNYEPEQVGRINDRFGELLMKAAFKYRYIISSEDFNSGRYQTSINAILAAEDKRFWAHDGWDWSATIKEGTKNALGMSKRGASTITQQVTRNIYPPLKDMVARQGRSELILDTPATRLIAGIKGYAWTNKLTRKGPEIRFAVHVERELSEQFGSKKKTKEFILTTYSNIVYLGHGVYGMAYASQFYFGKSLEVVSPAEAAFLASLIPAPDIYSKVTDKTSLVRATMRRNAVLQRMADNGFISEVAYAKYSATPLILNIKPPSVKTEAPSAINTAFRELPKLGYSELQLHRGDVQLTLTVDARLQRALNMAFQCNIYGCGKDKIGFHGRYPSAEIPQGAGIVLDNGTGAILAVFGGWVADEKKQWNAHQMYNRAMDEDALRQPGSTFKLFDVVAAVMNGFTPDSPVSDTPFRIRMGRNAKTGISIWKESGNYDSKNLGWIPLREAMGQSRNHAFLHLMHDQVGTTPQALATAATMKKQLGRWQPIDPGAAEAIRWAREMGVKSRLHPEISTVLGANGIRVVEMANAIRTVCSGQEADPYIIQDIKDRTGESIYHNNGHPKPFLIPGTQEPVSKKHLGYIQELLRGNVLIPGATAHSLESSKFPIEVMGKTGTSNDFKDGWFIGCSPGVAGISAAIWIGYDDFAKELPNRGLPLWEWASGGRVALPVFRDFMLAVYGNGKPLGYPPKVPKHVEDPVVAYVSRAYARK